MTKPKTFLSNLIIKPIKSFLNKDEQKEEDLEKIAAREQKIFSYDVLVSATNNFSLDHKLGEGGFGPVYKGKLEDGRVIAVKKLSLSSNQGKKEFMNEAKLLARVQHRNVVNLLGYCIHGNDKLLVYEYLHNQSLDKFLFHNKKRGELDWNMRYDVILGVARGLLYLHEDSHVSIIHRDIKASNILLDEKWTPKIADFGMARLFPEDQTHVNTRVAGTNGYMAPEYVMHGQLSNKADVYSFGVLVLELVSGKKNSTFYMEDAQNLLEWAWMLYKKEKSLELMDAVMVNKAPTEQVDLCIKMGLLCVQAAPKARPTMRRVVVMLSRKSVPEEPTEPGYPGYRYNRRRVRKLPGSTSTAESGESSQRLASTSSMTGSSAESSQNYDSTFNASSSSTSTIPRPHQRSHGRHGNGPASHASSSSSTPTNTRPRQHSHEGHGNGPASHASSSSSTPTNTRPHQRSHGRHGNGRASHALVIRSPDSQPRHRTSTPTITSPITDHSAGKRPATH